jgi:hypothetical protein
MPDCTGQNAEQIDHVTSRSICKAIGERLRNTMDPEQSELPSRLQHLMEELQRRDGKN